MSNIFIGDSLTVLKSMKSASIQTCVTSPPYFGLRDYGMKGQMGLEQTPEAYVVNLVELFREVRRVLRDDGTLWLNLGDSYNGSGKGAYGDGVVRLSAKSKKQKTSNGTHAGMFKKTATGLKPKDLIGIPWRVAFALQADGWYLRQDIIWAKPNPMPESVTDRCTKAHEYIFLLSKSPRYYFDNNAIREPHVSGTHSRGNGGQKRGASSDFRQSGAGPKKGGWNELPPTQNLLGRNKRTVWTIGPKPYKGAHFATFPPALIEPCILAGTPKDGIVLDPFFGSGTTGAVAKSLGRQYIGIELNPVYVTLAKERLAAVRLPLAV